MKKLFLISLAVLLVAAFTLPAMAAEWSFYGSVRQTFYAQDSEDGSGNSDSDIKYQGQGNSRLGGKVKGGAIKGYFEIGQRNDGNYGSYNLYTRKMYGQWDFGSGSLKIGKDYTNYASVGSSQLGGTDDTSFCGSGQPYGGRRDQIELQIGGFELALVETGYDSASAFAAAMPTNPLGASGWAGASLDTVVPMINAKYTHKIDPLTLTLAGTYLSYDLENKPFPDKSIDCYSVQLGAQTIFGPLRLSGAVYYAQNNEQMGLSGSNLVAGRDGFAIDAFGNVIDNDTLGWALVANYKLNDMIEFQAGYAYIEHEWDSANAEADDDQSYYLQATIEIAKGFYIVPEIGVLDQKNSGTIDKTIVGGTGGVNGGPSVDEGDITYFAMKLQMDF